MDQNEAPQSVGDDVKETFRPKSATPVSSNYDEFFLALDRSENKKWYYFFSSHMLVTVCTRRWLLVQTGESTID